MEGDMKTKYRIIPLESYIGDMFLQFEDNGVWKFVPEERHSYVTGKYLKVEDCPTEMPDRDDHYFLHCYYKNQDYNIIPFTKLYKNIQDYFDYLNIKREEYLKEKEEKGKAPIIYLQ